MKTSWKWFYMEIILVRNFHFFWHAISYMVIIILFNHTDFKKKLVWCIIFLIWALSSYATLDVFVCVLLCLFVFMCLDVSVCFCMWLYMFVCVCLCLYVFLCVCMCLYVFVCVSCVCVCLYVFVCVLLAKIRVSSSLFVSNTERPMSLRYFDWLSFPAVSLHSLIYTRWVRI